jgi:LCP family protein required for cell wall assembly
MSQAPSFLPPGKPPRPGRSSARRRRTSAVPAVEPAAETAAPRKVGRPARWKPLSQPVFTFAVGLSLGLALAAPARTLGSLLASVQHGPKAVTSLFAPSSPTVLVLGSDQVSGSTDVMFTVKVGDGLTRLTQVPRDTFVETPSLGAQKVNALYASAGIDVTRAEVGKLVGGTPLEKYLKVNLQAVERVAEALGGVEVDVPKRMYYVDNAQGLMIDLYPGRQKLQGRELEGFLRFRHDEAGDLGRMDRQRLVINQVFRQLAQPSTLVKLPALLKIAGEDIQTNLSAIELSQLVSQMGRSKLSSQRLPGRMYWQDDLSYWMPDSNKQHPFGPGEEPSY